MCMQEPHQTIGVALRLTIYIILRDSSFLNVSLGSRCEKLIEQGQFTIHCTLTLSQVMHVTTARPRCDSWW